MSVGLLCKRLGPELTYGTTDTDEWFTDHQNVTQRAEGGGGEEGSLGPQVTVSFPPDSVAEGESEWPQPEAAGTEKLTRLFPGKEESTMSQMD